MRGRLLSPVRLTLLLSVPLVLVAYVWLGDIHLGPMIFGQTEFEFFTDEGLTIQHHVPVLDRWTLSSSPPDSSESILIDRSFQFTAHDHVGIKYRDWHLGAPLRGYPAGTVAYWKVAVHPGWVLLAVATPLFFQSAATIRTWLKTQRRGICPKCGYDLRASPDRCPECGTATAAEQP